MSVPKQTTRRMISSGTNSLPSRCIWPGTLNNLITSYLLFDFPIFRYWGYLVNVIPETRRMHLIWYLRFLRSLGQLSKLVLKLKLVWIILHYSYPKSYIIYIFIISLQHKTWFIYILQVTIDNEKNLLRVQSGFLGRHENDANFHRQIGSIGPNAHLKFPADCYILGDCIYSNGYPVITPYKVTDIIRQPRAVKRARRRFSRLHRRRRVFVGN